MPPRDGAGGMLGVDDLSRQRTKTVDRDYQSLQCTLDELESVMTIKSGPHGTTDT